MKITLQKIHLFAMMMVSLSVVITYALGTLEVGTALPQLALVGLCSLLVKDK